MPNFMHCPACGYLIVNMSQPCPSCGEAGHVVSAVPPVSPSPAYQPDFPEYTPGQRQFEREERLKKIRYVKYAAAALLFAVIAASVLTFAGRGGTGRDSRSNDKNLPAPANVAVAENVVEQPRPVVVQPAQTKVVSQGWKTEIHGGINFKIEYSWKKERNDDGSYYYFPPVSEFAGAIQSVWGEVSIGKLSDADARRRLDGGIAGGIKNLNNTEEIDRVYFKIGDKYAVRANFYYDLNNGARGRTDMVLVLFEDGFAGLASYFTVAKYEPYKDIIETALGSIALERRAAPSPVQPPAQASGNRVSASFKQTMDSYEAFFDKYAQVMSNPNGNIFGAIDVLAQYADTMQKLNDIDSDKLSAADAAYYFEVQLRIMTKLGTAAQSGKR